MGEIDFEAEARAAKLREIEAAGYRRGVEAALRWLSDQRRPTADDMERALLPPEPAKAEPRYPKHYAELCTDCEKGYEPAKCHGARR